jgi:hypothetical protein
MVHSLDRHVSSLYRLAFALHPLLTGDLTLAG